MFDLTTKPATMHTVAQASGRLYSNVGCGLSYWSETEFNNSQDPIKTASFYKDSSV